jgi:hypothetical protein
VDDHRIKVDGDDLNPHSAWNWDVVGDEKLSSANQFRRGRFGGVQELSDCAIADFSQPCC